MLPVERLTDVFSYVMTSDLEIAAAQDNLKMAQHEKAKDEAFENNVPEPDPPELLSEARKAEL